MVDMMVDKNSVSRNSRRWPLTVFFALLNIFCVNFYILYIHNPQNKLKRRKFIKNNNNNNKPGAITGHAKEETLEHSSPKMSQDRSCKAIAWSCSYNRLSVILRTIK